MEPFFLYELVLFSVVSAVLCRLAFFKVVFSAFSRCLLFFVRALMLVLVISNLVVRIFTFYLFFDQHFCF